MKRNSFPELRKAKRVFNAFLAFCVLLSSMMFSPAIYAAPFRYGEAILPIRDVSVYSNDYYINKKIIAGAAQNYHKHPEDGGAKDVQRIGLEEVNGPMAYTYLRYDISSLPASGFTEVSLDFTIAAPAEGRISVYALHSMVSEDNWSENMTWSTNKLVNLTDSIDTIDISAADTLCKFNVTKYIKTKKAAGASTVDLLLKAETPCNIELRGHETTEGGAAGLIPSLVVRETSTGLHEPQEFTPQVKFKYNTDMKPIHDVVAYNPATSSKTDGNKNYHEIDTSNSIDDKMNAESNKSYTYFKFDISDFPEPDKIGKTLFSVYGRDTSKTSGAPSTNYAQIFAAADTGWKETELTWNNKPVLDSTPIAEILYKSSNTLHDVDITEYVKAQKQKGAKYITLAMVPKNSTGTLFHRGKNTVASGQKPPRIIVADPAMTAEVPEYLSLEADGRSRLYPEGWYPGYEDSKGRFLHDFSYAGYQRGEKAIPETDTTNSIDVTKAPYNADRTGKNDATLAIQGAIDDAAQNGGGVVYLPEGTYKVNPQEGKNYSLALHSSNVVVKGAGMNKTFIYNATENMKQKSILYVGNGDWKKTSVSTLLKKDELEPTVLLTVEDASKFQVDDYVLIDFITTQDFLLELGMQNKWASRLGNNDPLFYRKIMAVDTINNTITLDMPTRYALRQRDSVRITKTKEPVSEVGLEDFSIANVQNSKGKSSNDEDDYKLEGTAGYECDNAKAINVVGVANSWIRNINTYKPEGNAAYHILSKGIILDRVKNVTVDNCTMEYPQYRGANGNGYLYQLTGNDCLIINSKAVAARHSFTYANFSSNGNVLYKVYSETPSLASDFHMYLSMANLIDNMTVKGDRISALTRDYGSSETNRHGVVTTESVFWNTTGIRNKDTDTIIVESEQFGNGYVIGTKGEVTGVNINITSSISDANTKPYDMAEGVGEGDRLLPQSLYKDQFSRRFDNEDLGLKTLLVNGKVISGMQALKSKYTHTLPFGTTAIPTISAAAISPDAAVTITQPTAAKGTGMVRVEKGGAAKEYVIEFKVQEKPVLPKSITLLPDKSEKGWMASGNVIGIGDYGKLKAYLALDNGETVKAGDEAYPVRYSVTNEEVGVIEGDVFKAKSEGAVKITAEYRLFDTTVTSRMTVYVIEKEPSGPFATIANVSASKDDGNIPQNTVDGNRETRWSADGVQEYLLLELDKEEVIDKVSILFYSGDARSSKFDVEVSTDGITYTKVLTDMRSTKKGPNNFNTFAFTPVRAKYVKYIGKGNELNTWNSILELWVHIPVALNKTSSSLVRGGTDTLIATVGLNGSKAVAFTSSSNAVSVSQAVYDTVYGTTSVVITGITAGSAVITATTEEGGYTAQAVVEVTEPVTGVSLNRNAATLKIGAAETLAATVSPANARDKTVTFTSNTNAVTVSQAVYNPITGTTSATITGNSVGTATVTATTADGSKSAACLFTVISTSGSSSGPSVPPSVTPTQDATVEGEKILVKPLLEGEKGISIISKEYVENALKAAAVNSKGNKEIVIKVPELKGAKQYVQRLPVSLLSSDALNFEVRIETPLGGLAVPANLLKGHDIPGETQIGITVAAGNTSGVKSDLAAAIGNKPVVEFLLMSGDRTLEWKNSQAAVEASLVYTPTPEELKNPEHIVVWGLDENGNKIPVQNGKYDGNTGKVTFTAKHFGKYAVAYYQKTFDDISDYSWAKKEIEVMASKGIIDGTAEKTYAPGMEIKRADLLLLIVKSLGLTAEIDSNFSDVKQGDYYYEALGIAKKLGLAQGQGENKFNPEEFISRQDMMVLIERALKITKKVKQEGTVLDISKYSDISLIAPYAVDSISTLVREGIIGGSREMLNPLEKTTRAEAAVVIYRIYNR